MFMPMFSPVAGVTAASVSAASHAVSSSGLSTYTFASQSLGSAAASRKIIVAVMVGYSASRTFTSVTVGGVTATALLSDQTTTNTRMNLFIADVPNGATGDVVVTMSGACLGCGVGVFAAYDLMSSTPVDTSVSTAEPGVCSVDISAGGIAVGYAVNANSANTYTWTNLTEAFDEAVNSGSGLYHSGACAAFGSAQTGLSITADRSGSPAQRLMGAVSLR